MTTRQRFIELRKFLKNRTAESILNRPAVEIYRSGRWPKLVFKRKLPNFQTFAILTAALFIF